MRTGSRTPPFTGGSGNAACPGRTGARPTTPGRRCSRTGGTSPGPARPAPTGFAPRLASGGGSWAASATVPWCCEAVGRAAPSARGGPALAAGDVPAVEAPAARPARGAGDRGFAGSSPPGQFPRSRRGAEARPELAGAASAPPPGDPLARAGARGPAPAASETGGGGRRFPAHAATVPGARAAAPRRGAPRVDERGGVSPAAVGRVGVSG